jgi:hypothetical protein
MTERDRLLTVLAGKIPDRVPWFADLGHWYRAEAGGIWNLFQINNCNEEMASLHKEVRAGWYIEAGSLHEEKWDGVTRERELLNDKAIERFVTPLGTISMTRIWSPESYSWNVGKLMVETIEDLKILIYAISHRTYLPKFENWKRMEEIGGDIGLGFPSMGYTGLGSLISYYMGIENTVFAIYDEPQLISEFIHTYNEKHLELVDIYAKSPAPHMLFTDNLSSDVQSPDVFKTFSLSHYRDITTRLHKSGKTVSAHIDGRMDKLLPLLSEAGIDIADACTPKPTGDLVPSEIRKQAGNQMVIMGGISPNMWLSSTPEGEFIEHVKEWLILKDINPRIVQSAGDQVPPGTSLQRIKLVYDLVEEYGRYQPGRSDTP